MALPFLVPTVIVTACNVLLYSEVYFIEYMKRVLNSKNSISL
jgi:hypothetical protein